MIRKLFLSATSALARLLGLNKPVRLTPEYALLPEILVVADGYQGAKLLKQVRGHVHLSVYWPGRGEAYIAGRTAARVTFLSEYAARRLSVQERDMLHSRMATWADRALWLEASA